MSFPSPQFCIELRQGELRCQETPKVRDLGKISHLRNSPAAENARKSSRGSLAISRKRPKKGTYGGFLHLSSRMLPLKEEGPATGCRRRHATQMPSSLHAKIAPRFAEQNRLSRYQRISGQAVAARIPARISMSLMRRRARHGEQKAREKSDGRQGG